MAPNSRTASTIAGVGEEHRAGVPEAHVGPVERQEGRERGEGDEAEHEDEPGAEGRRVQEGRGTGRVRGGHVGRAEAEQGREEARHPRHDPHAVVPVGVGQVLPEGGAEGQPAVERDAEVGRRLAPPVRRRHVLRRRGGAHEDRRLADPGQQPERHQRRDGIDLRVREGGQAHQEGPAAEQDAPAVAIAEAPGPRADERRGHRERTDHEAHREPVATQLVLDVARERREQRTEGQEVGEGGEGDDQEPPRHHPTVGRARLADEVDDPGIAHIGHPTAAVPHPFPSPASKSPWRPESWPAA